MIIFVYGPDTFRSREKLKELKNKFIKEIDPNGNDFNILLGQNTSIKEINEKISTGSLFTKKKMTIIENIFENKDKEIFPELVEYIKKNKLDSGDDILIFFDHDLEKLTVNQKKLFTFLKKQKYIFELPLLNNAQLNIWIKNKTAKEEIKIQLQVSQEIINLTGNDLWRINNDVNKLINYKKKEKEIKVEDVKELVSGDVDENIFALTDAISQKNKQLAIKLLEEQYEAGLSNEYIIFMLIRQLKILLQIKTELNKNLNADQIIQKLKLHPFIIKKGIIQARNFTILDLKNSLNRLIEIDFLSKTGQAKSKTLLNLFIVNI